MRHKRKSTVLLALLLSLSLSVTSFATDVPEQGANQTGAQTGQ